MTYEEQQQYNKLPYNDQKEYDHYKSKYPHWSHNQIMTRVSTGHVIDKRIGQGKDVNPEDPRVLKEILEGAKAFLVGVGIFIASVFYIIDETLETLGDLIYRGITYIGEKLGDFWDWLTS